MRFAVALLFASLVQGAPPDFRGLYAVMEKALCRQCHNDNGVGSTTRLQFPPEDADPGEIREFGIWLRNFVDAQKPLESLLYRKPTHRLPHGGGERITQGSKEEAVLRQWVEHLAALPPASPHRPSRQTGPSRPVLRRLTHSQYNQTVRDLAGDETRPADQFPKEDFVHGFTNQAAGQSVSPIQAEAYARAAERIARNAFRNRGSGSLIPCSPSPACRARFVRTFGKRAFRRPLSEAEAARYESLFAREADFHRGAQLVMETMLQSPHFLFRLEPGLFGVASRLSYFLWNTMPDEALLEAAESGELGSQAGLEKQIRRMLKHHRAYASLDQFLGEWLRFDRLRGALRDRRLFPEYSPELVSAMIEETTRLFRSVVWENRSFLEFFTAGYTFLNADLARLYGLSAPSEPWTRTAFPAAYPRSGMLGHAAFLTLTSKPAETSPTERGFFIREHFLCQQVPPPPPGVNATLPPVTDEKPLTQRERLSIHLSNQACAGCHTLVDPIGFGFEHFDAIGRFREKERIEIHPTADEIKTRRKTKPTEYLLDIESSGTVRGLKDSEFRSPAELGRILAREPNCQKCVVKQLFRYAYGRMEEPRDREAIDGAFIRFRDSQFRFQELIMAIASSDGFRGRN
jgi:hypothetical protein